MFRDHLRVSRVRVRVREGYRIRDIGLNGGLSMQHNVGMLRVWPKMPTSQNVIIFCKYSRLEIQKPKTRGISSFIYSHHTIIAGFARLHA